MKATFVASAPRLEELPASDKPQIAMVGRSNVGKSSLLNHLTGTKGLARVSAEPGRTQMINVFDIDGRIRLIDLPGYGFAKASKSRRDQFAEMVHDYLAQAPQLKLVFLIVDARHDLTALDRDMLAYLQADGIPFVVIANKIDKLSRSETTNLRNKLEAECANHTVIPHSNVNGQGRGEIWDVMERVMRGEMVR